eukprot:4683759-Amphidinium_carterae.1
MPYCQPDATPLSTQSIFCSRHQGRRTAAQRSIDHIAKSSAKPWHNGAPNGKLAASMTRLASVPRKFVENHDGINTATMPSQHQAQQRRHQRRRLSCCQTWRVSDNQVTTALVCHCCLDNVCVRDCDSGKQNGVSMACATPSVVAITSAATGTVVNLIVTGVAVT